MPRPKRLVTLAVVGAALAAWGWSAFALWNSFDAETVDAVPEAPGAEGGVLAIPAEITVVAPRTGDPEPIRLRLRNGTGRALRITGTESSCACTVPDLRTPAAIGPGEELAVTVRATPPQVGEKQASVTFHTDWPERPTVVVPVRLVGRPVEVPFVTEIPNRIVVRTTRPEPVEREFTLRTTEAADSEAWLRAATIDGAAGEVARLDVTDAPGPASWIRRVYRWRVRLPAPPADGATAAFLVRFETAPPAPAQPKTVEVACRFVPAVSAAPEEVVFRLDEASEPAERTILFQREDLETPVAIRPLPLDVDWLEVGDFEPQPPGSPLAGRVPVRLLRDRLPDGAAAAATVRFASDHPDAPELAVRVAVR